LFCMHDDIADGIFNIADSLRGFNDGHAYHLSEPRLLIGREIKIMATDAKL
jgi:hypothetical protein